MRCRHILLLIAAMINITSCKSYDFSQKVVQQGNLLPQSKIERLHLGMSKENTAILMGTSLLGVTFNNDRWDYAYTWRRGNNKLDIKRVSLYFHNDTLVRIEHHP